MNSKNTFDRRTFLTGATAVGIGGTLGAGMLLSACSGSEKRTPLSLPDEIYIPELPDKAIDGKPIKAALIGCGARGTGAAFNFLDAGDGLSIVACADLFKDRLDTCRNELKEKKNVEIPDDMCFLGFDAYKKVCELPVDLVIIATPNCFHPEQLKYAVEQGKHVFVEKPAAIDPVGYRTCMVALKQAKAKGLNVISGAQYHYDRPFVESYKKVREGYIGKITSGNVFYNTSNEQFVARKPGWSDTEYMIRGHFNWNCINGDQLSNMLIHWLDVFMWFSHLKPVKVNGFGSRIRRKAGNVYDNFSMDFEFEGGVHVFGMVRRMDGCDNMRGAVIQGDKGSWSSDDFSIRDLAGNVIWKYDEEATKAKYKTHDMYTLEHIDLVSSIRKGKILNIAEVTADSALACVMARESAYTGKVCTWEQMLTADLNTMPEGLESWKADIRKYTVSLPGVPGKDTETEYGSR